MQWMYSRMFWQRLEQKCDEKWEKYSCKKGRFQGGFRKFAKYLVNI